jgi:hypothetical protein
MAREIEDVGQPTAVRCRACGKTLWEAGMAFEVFLTGMHGDHEQTVLEFTPVTFVHMTALCSGPDEEFGVEIEVPADKKEKR